MLLSIMRLPILGAASVKIVTALANSKMALARVSFRVAVVNPPYVTKIFKKY